MFESFGRGFRMVFASIKMGWEEKRLLLPSILTVFSNFFFATLLLLQAKAKLGGPASGVMHGLSQGADNATNMLHHGGIGNLIGSTALNGPMDQGGFGAMSGAVGTDIALTSFAIICVWWLTNRFLEGVTTALVYSHLTEGSGSGKFATACEEVLKSLPALVVLGLATLVAKKIASFLRNKKGAGGFFGMGFSFLAGIVEIFWTLAGHLILPSIVIEGTSFWGAMKRADKIAQGNLLTIGVGEVGVDAICAWSTGLVQVAALAAFGYAMYAHIPFVSPLFIMSALVWAMAVVVVTAASIYIRSAFYTCLYVWAIESEAVEEADRVQVRPPAPLAAALA